MRSSLRGLGGPQVQENNDHTMTKLIPADFSSSGEGAPLSVCWGWGWLLGGGDLWAGFYRMSKSLVTNRADITYMTEFFHS